MFDCGNNCRVHIYMSVPKRIFIVPYRDREAHKKEFLERMTDYLADSNDWEIYFAHQCDKRPFNRGAVKNIGFLAIKAKYPNDYKDMTFIFHDVDTWPRHNGSIHYTTKDGTVSHFYGAVFALGGMFAIKGKDFEKTEGFPNFWGWGFEDNLVQERCVKAGLKIDRSCFFKMMDRDNIVRKNDGYSRVLSARDQCVYNSETPDGITEMASAKWTINGEMINITGFEPSMMLEEQTFFTRSIMEGGKIRAQPGFARKNWNMGVIMKNR